MTIIFKPVWDLGAQNERIMKSRVLGLGELCSPRWWVLVEKPEGTNLPQIPRGVSEGRFSSIMLGFFLNIFSTMLLLK